MATGDVEKIVVRDTTVETNRQGGMPKQEVLLYREGDEIPEKGRMLLPRSRGGTPFPEGEYEPKFGAYFDRQWGELRGVINDLRPVSQKSASGPKAVNG